MQLYIVADLTTRPNYSHRQVTFFINFSVWALLASKVCPPILLARWHRQARLLHVTSRQVAYFSDVHYKLRKARGLRPAKTLALSVACENLHHRCHYHTTCSETPGLHPTKQFSFLSMWNSHLPECCCEQAPKA